VPSARHDGVVVLPRVRFAVTRETETQSAPGSDAPAAPPAS
jgi:hypothetical protein